MNSRAQLTGSYRAAEDRHRTSVTAAEIRRLERHLRALGPMPRHRLAELCGAQRWHEGTFHEALREGVRQGRLRELPQGWIAVPLSASVQ